ncbi:metallophosphoesterase family protein [Dermatobacter hominis]|uniref:metallophosphoesterase family protein n=1 Tax=Dermatobacter hominis TaxID=2884263 RepID=UPI001D11E274|nr:metallophosphoesterase [Dermatobacter hominis]UDY37736.1 metallophosphoesterase [Dermatobacter hominis]
MTTTPRRHTVEHVARPRTAGAGLDVFAVEDRGAQLVWSSLPAGPVSIAVDGPGGRSTAMQVEHAGGPGAVELTGLRPGSRHVVEVRAGGERRRRAFRTQPAPPGEELFRFATLNDLHLGREEVREASAEHRRSRGRPTRPAPPTPLDMARDALTDALDWGAASIVVKGDVCDQSYDRFWDQAAALFGGVDVPVHMLPGNHDTGSKRLVEPEVAAKARGLHLARDVEHVDLPGLRVVLVESGIPGNGWGRMTRHADEVADLAADAAAGGSGTFVATHHQPQRFRVPLYWPHGTPGPDAMRFAGALGAATPHAVVSSGHTHRCRVRRVAGVPWSEVGATNHFPATWAGYRVFEGGLMQVVRRTARPRALAWSERSRSALGGVWALWATGTLSDRSFTLDWT